MSLIRRFWVAAAILTGLLVICVFGDVDCSVDVQGWRTP